MKVLLLLNGGNLHRFAPDLPERLVHETRHLGHEPVLAVSKSLDHMLEIVGQAIEDGADAVLSGGGDGTLHHVANHPAIGRVALGALPLGTINAFLRSLQVDPRLPITALRQLLRGRVADGWCGSMNGRRFVCFASWGFDARVIHGNSSELKRKIGGASYGVAALRELWNGRRTQVPGELRIEGTEPVGPVRCTSLIVSKIDNYAGIRPFSESVETPKFEALYTPTDRTLSTLAMWTCLGIRGTTRRDVDLLYTRFVPGIDHIDWVGKRPTTVQFDGEDSTLDDTQTLRVEADRARQRFLVPE